MQLFNDNNRSDRVVAEGPEETIGGAVAKIIYHNPSNGYTVLLVDADDGAISAVGRTIGLSAGESIRMQGRWVTDRKYGRQFSFEMYELLRPATADAIIAYLGSGIVKGIGKRMAKRLVDRFGAETLDVLEREPQKLRSVSGIGRKRAQALSDAWKAAECAHRVMVFLQQHGLGPALAARIYQQYGPESMTIIEREPYRLADEVFGVGFHTADQIARASGIEPDDPGRIGAGLKHTLDRASGEGHFYLPREELLEGALALLQVAPELVETRLDTAIAGGEIIQEDYEQQTACSLPRLNDAERRTAAFLLDLAAASTPAPPELPKIARWLQERERMGATPLSEEQTLAVHTALTGPVSVITGGPGTGKTTVTRAICDACASLSWSVSLCSPTGRAAKRLSQLAGRPASTIHRLLAYDPSEHAFRYNADEPLQTDVLIVDESSMVDVLLARHLLEAVKRGTKIVFIGDADQLPSVGPGSFFKDIVASGALPVAWLTQIFRQDAGGDIVQNAHLIRQGEPPRFVPGREWEGEDTVFMERAHPDQVAEAVLKVVTSGLRSLNYAPDDIQVITPMHRGPAGVTELNKRLQAVLNPETPGEPQLMRGPYKFRCADRVLQNVNNYEKSVYNGDIGRIVEIDLENSVFNVEFDQGRVVYDFTETDQLQLAYALTVHKSQGSEYPAVVMVIHSTHYIMLRRNLLYTALTRAQSMAVVIGDKKGLWTAVRRSDEMRRYTRLQERLKGLLPCV